MTALFKTCQMCKHCWADRNEFLADTGVSLIGYQSSFKELVAGIFLFDHACGETMSLEVRNFTDLYSGPMFRERRTGMSECPAYCLEKYNLNPCPAHCECAFVREIMQVIKQIPKKQR
jgi:hypothetical protein